MPEPRTPDLVIEIKYTSEHSTNGIKRTIFVYPEEDPNIFLSKAWRPNAVSAQILKVKTTVQTRLKPSRTQGEWNVTS